MTFAFEVKNDLVAFDAKNDKIFFDTTTACHMTFFRVGVNSQMQYRDLFLKLLLFYKFL